MKKWYVVVEQNGGEYYGDFEVEANDVRQVNEHSICADGVIFRFDEKIDSFEEAAE
jgi:hypothetical protein